MSTEIVPAANIAALDTLDTEAREIAITGMLDQAKTWLAHAVESTAPAQDIANFKAYIATAAETAKRLKVSREIQQDAEVMVRRTERALGQAVRAGQERGEIARMGSKNLGLQGLETTTSAAGVRYPSELEPLYKLTDDVTDEQFEEALDRAQDERNVSRANTIRKVCEVKSGAERQAEKWERVEALAAEGYTRHQVAEVVGMSFGGLANGVRERGIDFPADRVTGKTRRIDTNRVIRESLQTIEGAVMALDLINPDDINPESAQEWVDSLTASISALSKAKKTIKESRHE